MPTISGNTPDTAPQSALWQFSLQVYRKPGVAEACVALQDDHGVDVNLLLCLLWLAAARRRLSAAEVSALDQGVAQWRQTAVLPLRALRRRLKGNASLRNVHAIEELRTRLKGVELDAERLQQQELEAMSASLRPGVPDTSPTSAAAANIAAYQSVLGREFGPGPIATLLVAMPDEARTTQ